MQISEKQSKAAEKTFELIAAVLGKNRTVHMATAISSCARLSGSFMFRSFNFQVANVSPGDVVLSDAANEKGPVLISFTEWILNNLDVSIDANKLNECPIEESRLGFLDALKLLQNKAAEIMSQHKLNYEEMAYSCAIATALLIKECQNELTVESAFNTAVYGFIEGSKTYPPELLNTVSRKKSIFNFWK